MAVEVVRSSSPSSAVNGSLVAARAEELLFQSPYFFLRNLPVELQQAHFGTGIALQFGAEATEEVLNFGITSTPGQWLISHLPWDSVHFGTLTYRLFTCLMPSGTDPAAMVAAAVELRQTLAKRGPFYAFSIVPAEDLALLQGLTGAGWQLIETRLHYYHDGVANFKYPRHAVRQAGPTDAAKVANVAAVGRNNFDRYHADPWFGPARADAYLATYARAAVEGFADAVLVPDEVGLPLDSFLATSDLRADSVALGVGVSRVLLTAVGPENRGWHVKLVAETVHRAREMGHQYVLMTTQATNRAVFRTSEKLGFKLGATSHVLACRG